MVFLWHIFVYGSSKRDLCCFSLQAKLEMDKYLTPQLQDSPAVKKQCQDSPSVEFFFDDQGSPYSINMNVYLPDIAYLRGSLCRQQRHSVPSQVKSKPVCTTFSPAPDCSVPPSLPDFTTIFSSPSAPCANLDAGDTSSGIYIKQEMPSFELPQDGHLFQLLNSELDVPIQAVSESHTHAMSSEVPSFHDLHLAATQTANKPYCTMPTPSYPLGPSGHFAQGHTQIKAPYLPPSPPTSEPGSPDRQKELLHNLTPPPSYAATIASKMAGHMPVHQASTSARPLVTPGAGVMPVRYNRRTNPDLEKRRIHHCDFPGTEKYYFILNSLLQNNCYWETEQVENSRVFRKAVLLPSSELAIVLTVWVLNIKSKIPSASLTKCFV